jgi:hypothetical protein
VVTVVVRGPVAMNAVMRKAGTVVMAEEEITAMVAEVVAGVVVSVAAVGACDFR